MLGTAVYNAFKTAGSDVLGLAHSRPTAELKALDLLDATATQSLFADFKPECTSEKQVPDSRIVLTLDVLTSQG